MQPSTALMLAAFALGANALPQLIPDGIYRPQATIAAKATTVTTGTISSVTASTRHLAAEWEIVASRFPWISHDLPHDHFSASAPTGVAVSSSTATVADSYPKHIDEQCAKVVSQVLDDFFGRHGHMRFTPSALGRLPTGFAVASSTATVTDSKPTTVPIDGNCAKVLYEVLDHLYGHHDLFSHHPHVQPTPTGVAVSSSTATVADSNPTIVARTDEQRDKDLSKIIHDFFTHHPHIQPTPIDFSASASATSVNEVHVQTSVLRKRIATEDCVTCSALTQSPEKTASSAARRSFTGSVFHTRFPAHFTTIYRTLSVSDLLKPADAAAPTPTGSLVGGQVVVPNVGDAYDILNPLGPVINSVVVPQKKPTSDIGWAFHWLKESTRQTMSEIRGWFKKHLFQYW